MSQNRLPEVKDPLADIADLAIKPMEELEEEGTNRQIDDDEELLEPKEKVGPGDVFKKYADKEKKQNIKLETKDKIQDNIEADLSLPEDSMRGKRGKDKKKRKKKVLTQSQLDGLAKGRAKSIETRRRKKEERQKGKKANRQPEPMPAPVPNTKLDYETFSSYMDMYEEKRKKKHSNTKEPHPNKVINSRMRPMPPQSKPRPIPQQKRVANWTGSISSFAQHKSGGGRWNYGI